MFKQLDYVMVVVADMGRSVGFYRDKLGLNLKFESPPVGRTSNRRNHPGPARRWPGASAQNGRADGWHLLHRFQRRKSRKDL